MKNKKIFFTIIILILLSAMATSQFLLDEYKKRQIIPEPFLPNSDIIKLSDIGLHNAAADLYWLGAIQYFGGGTSKTYEKLDDYLFIASKLDPKFSYPYAFGVLILPSIGQTDRSIELGLKGIQNSTPDWRIPYYLATTYHIEKNDHSNAAKYFDIAANTSGAPQGIRKVAASYGSSPDSRAQTEAIWEGIYDSTQDEVVRERAKNYIAHYELLTFLEQSAKEYYKINNKYPATLDDLVSSRILRSVPPDPLGLAIAIDETGRAVVK